MTANASLELPASANLGGFLALTSGTITVVDSTGATVINGVPVTAGIYTPTPFMLSGGGLNSVVTLGGGASGTLGTY
jgi:hypothetical protein